MDMLSSQDAPGLDALLDFYAAAGVDSTIGDDPIDRFAETQAALRQKAERASATVQEHLQRRAPERRPALPERPKVAAPARPSAQHSRDDQRTRPTKHDRPSGETPPPDFSHLPDQPSAHDTPLHGEEAVAAARKLAAAAGSLSDLKAAVDAFGGCGLRKTAKRTVFVDGDPTARLMFISGAPERDDDMSGSPLSGAPGALFGRMLAAIGLERNAVAVTCCVPWRPPGGREPTDIEAAICGPFVRRQVELVDPEFLVCLGGTSARMMLGRQEPIQKLRGQWLPYEGGNRRIGALLMQHPAYLLHSPGHKRAAWKDLLSLLSQMNGATPR